MELTWLPDTPQSRRRTRALRACANCQRKKKRCHHLRGENRSGPYQIHEISETKETNASGSLPIGSSTPGGKPSLRTPTPLPPEISRIERFVGDLNPEAVIREKIDATSDTQLRHKVGLWINSSRPWSYERNREDGSDADSLRADHPSHRTLEFPSVASMLHQRCSAARAACEHLPLPTRDHLIGIHFSRVNRILPLVDEESLTLSRSQETTSTFLERAICLVAAKDTTAGPHLRLIPDGPLMTPREFCSELYTGLVAAMNVGLEPDRITRIRILALMSLHSEGYEGAEAASMHLCQAIHQAQTVGLHLERPDRVPGDSWSSLFWCLWTLDKMQAGIGGRPILLADRDIGIERPNLKNSHSRSAFDVWFAISDLLSTVISFYRPSADHTVGWEDNFPTFEEIIGDQVREDLDFATLGLLELYYHAVSILSCRCKLSQHREGSKPSYIRQGLAAVRIYSLVATECFQRLPPLPIIPYAVALSMGVSYQQFRSSKLITYSDRAKASLEACCVLLEGLGIYWYSAEAMARLGRKALRQIQGTPGLKYHQYDQGPRLSTAPKTDYNNNNVRSLLSFPADPGASLTARPPASENEGNQLPINDVTALSEPLAPLTIDGIQGGEGFANIDNLFGDFLDLSLPTNFWDPVFLPSEDTDT